MIDLETLAEIRATLAAMKKTETLLQEAMILSNTSSGAVTTPRQAHLRSVIHSTNAHYQDLEESIKKLTELAQRMIDKRQSGKLAFIQGWEARLNDLIDRLTTEEYAQLRHKLEQIKAEK